MCGTPILCRHRSACATDYLSSWDFIKRSISCFFFCFFFHEGYGRGRGKTPKTFFTTDCAKSDVFTALFDQTIAGEAFSAALAIQSISDSYVSHKYFIESTKTYDRPRKNLVTRASGTEPTHAWRLLRQKLTPFLSSFLQNGSLSFPQRTGLRNNRTDYRIKTSQGLGTQYDFMQQKKRPIPNDFGFRSPRRL